jgi:endogenous inhibitor of DNA gyrase (YacG/DUF329 family)
MEGVRQAEWPDFPFCSPRCKLVDLGRWLGEAYRVPDEGSAAEATESADDAEIP